jgi:hypothetical protein
LSLVETRHGRVRGRSVVRSAGEQSGFRLRGAPGLSARCSSMTGTSELQHGAARPEGSGRLKRSRERVDPVESPAHPGGARPPSS